MCCSQIKHTQSRLSRHDALIHHTYMRLPNPASGRFVNLKFTVMDGAGLIFDFDMTEFGPNFGYVRFVIVERQLCIVNDVPRCETLFFVYASVKSNAASIPDTRYVRRTSQKSPPVRFNNDTTPLPDGLFCLC